MPLSLCQIVNPLASTGAEISAFSQNQEKYAKWNLPFLSLKKNILPVKIHPLMEKIQPLIMHHKIIKNLTTST